MKSNRFTYLLLAVCVILCMKSFAQGVCSSNALAPVFKQTFDSSSSSTTKKIVPSGFITNYSFQSSTALSDGEYIVTPLVQNSQKADWAVGGDHTGNTNGNMFLVNAGTGASLFFYQQVDNLCPGSVYSFSAWLVNVNTITKTKPICGSGYVYPKVTFNIKNTSGTILQSFTTDTLPLTKSTTVSPNWQQYGFQFALPAGTTSLILEMVDFYGGKPQCGNDLAIDDIIFSACTPTATAAFTTTSSICAGSAANINSSIANNPYSNPAYQWQKSSNGGVIWTNIGTPGTGASNFSITASTISDAGMYRVLVGPDVSSLSSSTCVTASNPVTLAVNPLPLIIITGPATICSGNTLALVTNTSGGTAPYSYQWTGPNGFSSTSANFSLSNVSTAATGIYSLTVSDNNSCAASGSKTVTVFSTPLVAPINGNAGGCTGSSFTLTDATPGGVWSSDNTSVAIIGSNGIVTLINGGTATISYTVSNGSCVTTVSKLITVAGVTMHGDIIDCNNSVIHFTANDPNYGITYSNNNPGNTYAWSVTGGAFSFQGSSDSSSQYPNVQLITGSSYLVKIQFTTGGITCSASQKIYQGTANADTIQGAHDTTFCYNISSINLTGKAPQFTNILKWTSSGTGNFSTPDSIISSYAPSIADKTAGVITLYLKGSSSFNSVGNCASGFSMDSIRLHFLPENTGVNSVQTICSGHALNFMPTSLIPGSNYTWISSLLSGNVSGNTFTGTGTINDSLINASLTSDGVIKYTITPYTIVNGNYSCAGTNFTYSVTVLPKGKLAVINTKPSICSGATVDISFNYTIPGSTFSWRSSVISGTVSGNSSSIVSSTTNKVSDLLTNALNTHAIVRYWIKATSASGCDLIDSTDVLIYGNPVMANAGQDQLLCNASSVSLNANDPNPDTGSWYLITGPSSISFASSISPNTSVSGLVEGTYQLEWTIRNTCSVTKDTVAIIISAPPFAGTLSSNATVCKGSNQGILSVTGYTGNIVHWESSTDGGNSWAAIINNTSNWYSYTNLTVTTLYRVMVQNGICGPVYSNPVIITIHVDEIPGIISSDNNVCAGNNSGTILLTGNSGNIIRWESSTDGGISWFGATINTSSIYSYNNLTVTTLFRAIIQNGNCGTLSTNSVTITVKEPTLPGMLSADATVCASSNNGRLMLSGYTGNIIQWETSVDNGINWQPINNQTDSLPYINLTATTLYRVFVQNSICSAKYSNSVTVTVIQAPTIAHAGADQVICGTGSIVTLGANSPLSGSGKWFFLSGPSTVHFNNDTIPNTTVTGLQAGQYLFEWNIHNACNISKDTVLITIAAQTNAGNLSANTTVCASSNKGVLKLTGHMGSILQWESSVDNGKNWQPIINQTDSLSYVNLTTTTMYRVLAQNSICSPKYSNSIIITVIQPPTLADAGLDQVICDSNSIVTLAANAPLSGSGKWRCVSGPSLVIFSNASDPNATVSGLHAGTYQFIWTISNGFCKNYSDTVSIIVDKVISAFTLSSINDCGKTTVQFNNNSQSTFGIKNAKWYGTTIDTASNQHFKISYTTEGSKDISLRIESNTGCVQTTQALYNVIVYDIPKANINAIADACRSQMVQVKSKVNSQDSIANLLWNLGNGTQRQDSVITVQYIQDGKYTIQLSVETINHCYDSTYKQLVVHALPVITVTNLPVICKGDSVLLTASGAVKFIWTDNNNTIVCDGCITTKVKPLSNQQYQVIGYNEYGCSQIKTTQVRVVQPLKLQSVQGDSICIGQSTQLFVSGASAYIWYPETGLSNKTASAPFAKPLLSTTYHVIGKDDFNCFSDTAEVKVIVGNATPLDIGKDTVISAGTVYRLTTNISPQSNEIRKWNWSSNLELSCKSCPSPTVRVSNDATISLLAINRFGCTSTDTIRLQTFCPATEIFIPNAFTPDGDGINDKLIVQGKGVKMIRYLKIFNRWGEVVFEKTNFLPGDAANAWDGRVRGKPASPDVFVYMCEVICEKGLPTIFKGNVAILK